MKILVVRHGQTEWNVLKKMQGRADIPLNGTGLEQAGELKKKIANKQYDIVYCSPLIRAKQTADIINDGKNTTVVYDDRLKERDYGEFEGASKTSFNYDDFWAYNKNIRYKSAENVQDFFGRIYEFLNELKTKYQNETVLIVCHAGVLKAIECYANGMMPDDEIGPFLPDNASVREYNL